MNPALEVRCYYCGAEAEATCRTKRIGKARSPHQDRIQDAWIKRNLAGMKMAPGLEAI